MERMTDRKLVLVKRSTRLEELIVRYNTVEQARFYMERLGSDFGDYQREDSVYAAAVSEVRQTLELYGRVQVVDRTFIPNFMFGPDDIVVVVGQDGLVANTLKYLDRQELIAVNPDPSRWDGVLLPFTAGDMKSVVADALRGRRPVREVSMAKASLNDGQTLYAVNDLFIGQKTHVSARYTIRSGQLEEQQSSSGVIVSTGLGATGWLKSVLAGAAGVAAGLSGGAVRSGLPEAPDWGMDYLYFSVREPFPGRRTGADVTFGKVSAREPLTLVSQMPENGVIFSDGVESDFLQFNAGLTASISVAEKKGRLVV